MSFRKIFFALFFTLLIHSDLFPAKFTVLNVGNAGNGSLRKAISDANANPGRDTVEFAIGVAGIKTITLISGLPQITDTLFIDGASDPFYTGNPLIEINVNTLGASGLDIGATAPHSHIHGLIINNSLANGIFIGANDVKVTGSYLGTNAAGNLAIANGFAGVEAQNVKNLIIGGSLANEGNLISGNSNYGVRLLFVDSTSIIGNTIGTDISGAASIANGAFAFDGAGITAVLSNALIIGGNSAAHRNLISGNLAGINLTGNKAQIYGNYIGTDATGTSAISNLSVGVIIQGDSNIVGGINAGEGNLISGNTNNGLSLTSANSFGNEVLGNLIGTDINGTTAIPNGANGIDISNNAKLNTIGGLIAAARNLISGNVNAGLNFSSADSNYVYGNYIGTDIGGTAGLGNQGNGIAINSAKHTFIGNATANGANIISSNSENGILISGAGADSNRVQWNYIGTDQSATANLANGGRGIFAEAGAEFTEIGGLTTAEGNIIANNAQGGVEINGVTTVRHSIRGNSIFDHPVQGIKLSSGNNLQTAPVLTGFANGPTTTIFGTFNSAPNTTYRLEFFTSPTSAQGKTFIGASTILTDPTGFYAVNETFAVTVTAAEPIITSTATAPNGDTSPFGTETILSAEIQDLSAIEIAGQKARVSWIMQEQEGNFNFDLELQKAGGEFIKIAETSAYELIGRQRHYHIFTGSLPLGNLRFRLLQKGPNGLAIYSKSVNLTIEARAGISLFYENPYKAGGHLSISLQESQEIKVSLINLQGKQLSTLFEGQLEAGLAHRISLDKMESLPTGIYMLQIESPLFQLHKSFQKN